MHQSLQYKSNASPERAAFVDAMSSSAKRYECKRAPVTPRLDGVVEGEAWDSAPFTEYFGNIVSSGPTPYFATRCKMREFAEGIFTMFPITLAALEASCTGQVLFVRPA